MAKGNAATGGKGGKGGKGKRSAVDQSAGNDSEQVQQLEVVNPLVENIETQQINTEIQPGTLDQSAATQPQVHTQLQADALNQSTGNETQAYNFKFLSSLNDMEHCTENQLAKDFISTVSTLLDKSFELDEELNQFFFELCIFAYKSNVVGPKALSLFMQQVWKVQDYINVFLFL